ncbi:MAG: S8 family serine peptidase, partial [Acidobacteria bacterium]|nr:S8 family serine peptidase [Acidobacteriota bacterium]
DEGERFTIPALFTLPITGVSLPRSIGLALKSFVDQNAAAGIPTIVGLSSANSGLVFDTVPQLIADFSSRGPTNDFLIKPDLLAPGTGSYAAAESQDPRGENRFPSPDPPTLTAPLYDPTGFTFASGTSFSAPRAAGAAALLLQLRPDWTPPEIKSALMTMSARPSGIGELGSQRVLDRGAGLIDMQALARLQSLILPPSMSFGRQVGATGGSIVRRFEITNRADRETTYQLAAQITLGDPTISVRVEPSTLTVGAGQSGAFFLTLMIRPNVPTADTDSEGFVQVIDRQLTIPQSLYVPFWVRTAAN